MIPIRVVFEKAVVPKPMFRYDRTKPWNNPGNLRNERIKRKNPRGILLVNPFDDKDMRQLLARAIPGLRMVYQAKQMPTRGYRFILVVKPTSVELIRKTCPKAIIIGLNRGDKYGKEKDYQKAGVNGYWEDSKPNNLLELIKRI